MKRNSISIYIIALAAILISSCGKKSEDMSPVRMDSTIVFQDQVYKFSFRAPKSWAVESVPSTATSYYSSQGAEVRFQKIYGGKNPEGEMGAKIEVGVLKGITKEQAIEDFKKSFEGIKFPAAEPAMLENQPALKITFSEGNMDDAFMGYRIYGNKDSVVTYFEAATFGKNRMNKYKAVFDTAEKSVKLGYEKLRMPAGKMDSATLAAYKEETKPSENFSNYNGNGYSISYPDNFNIQATSKGVKFEGGWTGATITVDVTPSNGSSLDAYAGAAAKALGSSPSGGTVGGEAAKIVNYSAASSYGSRAYLLVKGANAYRVTINWPKELESSFKPAFEKAANSFKLK
jgi:hypothetical protein